ncbi:MAG TPA: LacI family DNA-binding transcriptional regulator [Chloroflexia bacterium]|nr:LacI family DNA-binding transcriptional regulator [Chloroflexia bacterium]
MAVTLQDVAARAGVSAITVSRALNHTSYVGAETRARILAAVAELNYVPNAVASSLRSSKTQLLAFLTDITNPFWATVARGIEDGAMEAGYGVILCNTDEAEVKEARYVDLLLRRRIDGFIVVPTRASGPILQNLKRHHVPFVLVDRAVPGVAADCVRGDSRSGAEQLTAHLLATGARRIGLITGPRTVSTAEERVAGYQDALRAAGQPGDESLILYGQYTEPWGYQATQELMARPRPPDTLFAANNFIAIGVLEALHTFGLRVPEDVAVVCFDDMTHLTTARFLTTVIQPAQEMGRLALRLLLARLAQPDRAPEEIILPVALVVRRSCGCPFTAGRPGGNQ